MHSETAIQRRVVRETKARLTWADEVEGGTSACLEDLDHFDEFEEGALRERRVSGEEEREDSDSQASRAGTGEESQMGP